MYQQKITGHSSELKHLIETLRKSHKNTLIIARDSQEAKQLLFACGELEGQLAVLYHIIHGEIVVHVTSE